jgi:hypothetical protein
VRGLQIDAWLIGGAAPRFPVLASCFDQPRHTPFVFLCARIINVHVNLLGSSYWGHSLKESNRAGSIVTHIPKPRIDRSGRQIEWNVEREFRSAD